MEDMIVLFSSSGGGGFRVDDYITSEIMAPVNIKLTANCLRNGKMVKTKTSMNVVPIDETVCVL